MESPRNNDLDKRLENYFAMLRPSLAQRLKRRAANWQVYAAVGGSAMAMATGISASAIGTGVRSLTPSPARSSRTSRLHEWELNKIALKHPVQFAMAAQDAHHDASQAQVA